MNKAIALINQRIAFLEKHTRAVEIELAAAQAILQELRNLANALQSPQEAPSGPEDTDTQEDY